ncbi:MAG: DEAD/DEAH box helicase [Janthinobacterium lividum]
MTEDNLASAPPAPELVKPKATTKSVKRRPKASEDITAKKMIQEVGKNFRIQFPEQLEEKYIALFKDAITGIVPADPARIAYDPKGDIPVDKLTYLKVYQCHISEETLQQVYKFGKSNRFEFASDIAIRAHAASTEGKELEKMSYAKSTSALVLPKFKLGGVFKPFQKAGIAYALKTKHCFIADEMGLGKTVQGIGVMACDLDNIDKDGFKQPWIIVVPSSLRINWFRECKKWLPKRFVVNMIKNRDLETRTVVNRKTKESREVPRPHAKLFIENTDVFIMTYDKVHRFSSVLANVPKIRGIIFDESHYLKGRSTKRTIATKAWVADLDPEYVLLLSGTPLMNRPMDLISQLQILNRLQDFGGYNHFQSRYCGMSTTDLSQVHAVHKAGQDAVNDVIKPEDLTVDNLAQAMKDELVRKSFENMTALNKGLRANCYVRREKSDVLTDLPEKTRQTYALEINNRKDYEAIEADVVGYVMERATKDEKFLKGISTLKGVARATAISAHRADAAERAAKAEILVKIENLKQAAAFGKLASSKEWIDNFLISGKKLVIFATHRLVLDELQAMYPEALAIRASMSPEKRDEAVTEFQTNKKKKLILVGLKLAVGLTLTAASDTLTLEFGWTPAVHDQAEDRCHRIGQRNAVTAHYHVAARTIEEKIGALIEKKRRVVNSVAVGDPLHGAEQGSVLGGLLEELTGSLSLYN